MAKAPQLRKHTKRGWPVYELDGKRLPSVSQVLNCARKGPGLEWWFSKVVAEEAVDSLDDIRKHLETEGREETVKWLAGARNRHSSEAADEGTDIHAMIAAGDASDPRSAAALRFLSDRGYKVAGTEVQGANVRDGYAGTIDMVAEDPDGNLVVIDWKADTSGDPTKRPALYPEHAEQVAAYCEFDIVNAPFARQWRKKRSPRPVVVSLRCDGTYQAGTVDLDHSDALDGFRSCLYRWRATEAPDCDRKARTHGLYTELQEEPAPGAFSPKPKTGKGAKGGRVLRPKSGAGNVVPLAPAKPQRADYSGGSLCNYPIRRPNGTVIKLCENPVSAEDDLCHHHRDAA
ncbi:MAG: hypothetical protein F4Z31_01765 [Gemmatimonadetes bacterium]|nr:hypothetical protein [Gemmatimonadota bacterium]